MKRLYGRAALSGARAAIVAPAASIAAGLLMAALAGCGGSPTQFNPVSGRISSLAGLPPESVVPPGGPIPNPAPFLDAGRLTAANTEAGNVKLAARAYLTDHPSATRLPSDDLQPAYLQGPLQARYYTNPTTLRITRVDSVGSGWQDIVFSLSQQKWVKGSPDNDRPGDQDVP